MFSLLNHKKQIKISLIISITFLGMETLHDISRYSLAVGTLDFISYPSVSISHT